MRPRGTLAVVALGTLLLAPAPAAEDEARLWEAARLRGQALAEMEDGNYARAREHLERLAKLLPGNILPPINLAICYLRLDEPQQALREIARARALDPDNPQMLHTLALALELEPGREAEHREVLEHFAATHPHDVRPHYLAARAQAERQRMAEAIPHLELGLEAEPENLVLLADLLVAAAAARDRERAGDALNAIEDRLDGFDGSLAEWAAELRRLARHDPPDGLMPASRVVRNLLRPTELYQVHLAPLVGGRQPGGGMFPQQDFDPPLPKAIQGGQDIAITFAEADALLSAEVAALTPLAITAVRPGAEALLSGGDGELVASLFGPAGIDSRRWQLAPPPAGRVLHRAVDADELPDLVTASASHGVRLYSGRGGGDFAPGRTLFPPVDSAQVLGLFPLDVDHDGDLDLFVTRAAAVDLYLQNNGDGSWSERGRELGIAGEARDTTAAVVADLDDDGDLDLLTLHPGDRPRLYANPRVGAFHESGAEMGLDRAAGGARDARAGDFDGDGLFDLLVWGAGDGRLLLNRRRAFEPRPLPAGLPARWAAAEPGDYDNDGDLDFVIAPQGGGPPLLARNRRTAFDAEELALPTGQVAELAAADLDEDGDLDLVARAAGGGTRLWRNDGGNRNHWLRLSLKGRYENNSKNNVQGLFCRVESRVGEHFQATLGNGRVNHLGLGARRQADLVRVVWTNGIAQSWQLVSADRSLVEEQMLKGSCPFLYAWDGERFAFVTDLMWKSPLGMLLADGSAAPHQSARDFVLIPGESLREAGGELWLQVTEELWEAAYVDRQQLLAVDHPATVELVVDERFLPPPYPRSAPIHWLGRHLRPVAARDQAGRNQLARLARRDGDHVGELPLTRYQGLTEGHRLEIGFDGVPAGEPLALVLWGWILPTDTSINFALAQDSALGPEGPALELLGEDGRWRTLEPFIGFPNGKRKAMVVPLGDRLPGGRLTLRISTNLQIYWDAALLAVGEPAVAPVITALEPRRADLHYRGYSRLYRDSPEGPHLFDYSRVSVAPRFRDMNGLYTRHGPVAELLAAEDDRYVVMAPGDELTVRFDAETLPPLPHGWRRDYVLYTDGWVKDADIHTAHSQTVGPLPYHGMRAYPDRPEHRYPATAAQREFLDSYQTRRLSDEAFGRLLRDGIGSSAAAPSDGE